MVLGKVVNTVVSTRKMESLVGYKIMVVNRVDQSGVETGEHLVAVDRVGAGIGEMVIVTTGDSARLACSDVETPVDAVIVGIVD